MTSWVDSHCHLFLSEDEPAALLQRAATAGVDWVMCPGTDLASSLAARSLALTHGDAVKWAAGLHPHDASRWPDEEARLTALAADADAIGECGLDFYRNLSPQDAQIAAFRSQLALASDLGKPVIVHCRDAFAAVHAELEQAQLGEFVIMHCWTGGPKWTRRFDELGVTFSFAGPITFEKGETVRLAAAAAPRERTMIETDTPYLTPPPHRGEPNEPAWVVSVGEALAEVWGIEPTEVAKLTTATATRVFAGRT